MGEFQELQSANEIKQQITKKELYSYVRYSNRKN
jgi:hypothetical protein